MTLRSIIVDDELKSREVIKTLVESFCPEVCIVAMAEGHCRGAKSDKGARTKSGLSRHHIERR